LSRDSSGNYTLPPENPVVAGELITDVWCNTTMDDIAQALTESLDRGGRGGMLAPFRFADGTIMQPGAAWALETGSGFSRTDVGTLNVSVLGALNMTWDQNGVSIPTGKRISIIDPPVDPTDAVNLEALGSLPPGSEVGDGAGNMYAIGYRDIPRTNTNWERGKCWVTSTGITLNLTDMSEGYTYTVLNISGADISIAPGAGASLKATGSDTSATFSLAAYSLVTIWCESATVARVAAVMPLTAGDIIAALGYTPYDAANPAGYINAITAAQVITALGYNPVAPAGTFATGTWNINITGSAGSSSSTGNAATADYATNAGTANFATNAGNATTATNATNAANAANANVAASVTGLVRITSANISPPTAAAYVTAAHLGPPRVPDAFRAAWKCLNASGGYVPGDELDVTDDQGDNTRTTMITCNATNWSLNFSSAGGGPIARTPTHTSFNITSPDWALVFHGTWLP